MTTNTAGARPGRVAIEEERLSAADGFAANRDRLVAEGEGEPLVRLAAFLVFLLRDNARQGLDADVIAGDLRCGVIADLLKLTLDELEQNLVALSRLGLIRSAPAGALQIVDIVALEQLVDQPPHLLMPPHNLAAMCAKPELSDRLAAAAH